MKIRGYVKRSLSRKYAGVMGLSIAFFLVGAMVLGMSLQYFKGSYSNQIERLELKEDIAQNINNRFNSAFSDARGYFAYGNIQLKMNALYQGEKMETLLNDFSMLVDTEEDKKFLEDAQEFTNYYFERALPTAIVNYENDHLDIVAESANSETTAKIKVFQKDSGTYIEEVGDKLEDSFDLLIRLQTYVQFSFVIFIFIILITLLRITRMMFRGVGQPLGQLALAANDIANGKEVPIEKLDTAREDEIGALSIAFKKMVETVKEKEQHLVAQNEALLSHQEELQEHRNELEDTLEILKLNELKLKKRNEMINKISTSLEKQEVMDSIVRNMCTIIEADCGIMVLVNSNQYASFGVSQEGIRQFSIYGLTGLSERLYIEKKPFIIKRELEKREKGFHSTTAYSYDLYLPVLKSDHEVVAILVFSRFGDSFPQDDMEEYMALTKNIAISLEKIQLYEKSEEDRSLNQDILNTVQEGIQLVDVQGNIIQVNKQLKEMFDWKESQNPVGLGWKEWTTLLVQKVENQPELKEFLQKAIQTSSGNVAQSTLTYKMEESKKVIKVYCEGLYHGKEKIGTVIVHRDITKEFEVDQMKSEFVSTVSHELRTPLASILGFTELMINRELKPERQEKYLNTIYNETKRLTALINDFLDVQRMESGKQTYEKKFIELTPIIEKVIESQKINTDKHHFHFDDKGQNGFILGDRDKLEQVFTNIINNAIKYSPDGGNIDITLYQQEDRLLVEIKDEGLGIPKDSLHLLFSKFFRIDNSDRRRIGGTGLGLAIVQEIMKVHNGEVEVSSIYGEGSTFTLSFPLVPSPLEPLLTGEKKEYGYKVMIIEDDQTLGQLISQELRDSGFKISYFKKGSDALYAIEKEMPDAIVLDILLEDDLLDGWGIMEKLKRDESQKNIPIFVSTALDEKEKGYSLGATDYLIKPYKPSQLSKAIMQTLLKMGKIGQVYIPAENDKED
jgi:signal transduction histidine kinase/CheY-like chemotaxis protein